MRDFQYSKPGKYVAILNNTNFDGHYSRVFDFPERGDTEFVTSSDQVTDKSGCKVTASWYYLNRVDFVGCVEAVYPIEVLEAFVLKSEVEEGV